MATQSYAQIQKQIALLEAQAARLKSEEATGVAAKIKEAIAVYGFTVKDLFGAAAAGGRGRAAGRASSRMGAAAKYSDGQGGTWVGRGPRPRWLREALAAGHQLSDFAVASGAGASDLASTKAAPKKRGRKARSGKSKAGRVKFSDGAGNQWSGFGRQPAWFKNALAAGKTPADLSAAA